jgi:hypothetical protein
MSLVSRLLNSFTTTDSLSSASSSSTAGGATRHTASAPDENRVLQETEFGHSGENERLRLTERWEKEEGEQVARPPYWHVRANSLC